MESRRQHALLAASQRDTKIEATWCQAVQSTSRLHTLLEHEQPRIGGPRVLVRGISTGDFDAPLMWAPYSRHMGHDGATAGPH
jgi:hypothetical protein